MRTFISPRPYNADAQAFRQTFARRINARYALSSRAIGSRNINAKILARSGISRRNSVSGLYRSYLERFVFQAASAPEIGQRRTVVLTSHTKRVVNAPMPGGITVAPKPISLMNLSHNAIISLTNANNIINVYFGI